MNKQRKYSRCGMDGTHLLNAQCVLWVDTLPFLTLNKINSFILQSETSLSN